MILYTFISYMIESKKMDCYCLTKKQSYLTMEVKAPLFNVHFVSLKVINWVHVT